MITDDLHGRDAYCPGCLGTFKTAMIGRICSYCRTGQYAKDYTIVAGQPGDRGVEKAATEVDKGKQEW